MRNRDLRSGTRNRTPGDLGPIGSGLTEELGGASLIKVVVSPRLTVLGPPGRPPSSIHGMQVGDNLLILSLSLLLNHPSVD